MRLIDKNGKLFGILNIIDLVIILAIIIVGGIVWNKLSDKGDGTISATGSNKQEIYIVAEAYRQPIEVTDSIVEGDTLVAQNKYQPGKIDYVKVRDNDYVSTNKDGKLIAEKNPLEKTIEVGITCQANISGPYIDSGGQEIKVGLQYWIKTSKGQIKGYVKEIRLEQ